MRHEHLKFLEAMGLVDDGGDLAADMSATKVEDGDTEHGEVGDTKKN